ncbi:hypothetical protein, partial [Enterobacter kobei]|uniref:hypothetical protein n=1 Tax=Enterobacter kobei TaxID=208224 RepID=UPI001BD1E9B9
MHFWQVILRMRKIRLRTGSGERARNSLRGREALAGCRGGEPRREHLACRVCAVLQMHILSRGADTLRKIEAAP